MVLLNITMGVELCPIVFIIDSAIFFVQ